MGITQILLVKDAHLHLTKYVVDNGCPLAEVTEGDGAWGIFHYDEPESDEEYDDDDEEEDDYNEEEDDEETPPRQRRRVRPLFVLHVLASLRVDVHLCNMSQLSVQRRGGWV